MKSSESELELSEIEEGLQNLSDEELIALMDEAQAEEFWKEVGVVDFWDRLDEWAKRSCREIVSAFYPIGAFNGAIGLRDFGQMTGRLDASWANLINLRNVLLTARITLEQIQSKLHRELRWRGRDLTEAQLRFYSALAELPISDFIRILELVRSLAERCMPLVIEQAHKYSANLTTPKRVRFLEAWGECGRLPIMNTGGLPVVATKPMVVRTSLVLLGVANVTAKESWDGKPEELDRFILPKTSTQLHRVVVNLDWSGKFSKDSKSEEWMKDRDCVRETSRRVGFPLQGRGRPRKS